MRNWLKRFARLPLIGVLTLAGMAPLAPARAEEPRIIISESGPMGVFGGREYTWATGRMEGTVARPDGSTGTYIVPVTLYFPDRNSNEFGFVDVVNNADFISFTYERRLLGEHNANYTGDRIFSDFLRTEGFTYLAVQWSKMVTELLGPGYGVIENGEDGWEVLKDAARWLRNPSDFGGVEHLIEASEYVIGHGHSQGSGVLKGFLSLGQNRETDGSLVYDGMLLTGSQAFSCRILSNDATPRDEPGRPIIPLFFVSTDCPIIPADGKVILVRTQTEVEGTLYPPYQAPSYRTYDMAGAAHVPEFLVNLRHVGASRQNPINWQPVAWAMLLHLAEWIEIGDEPPPTLAIEGARNAEGRFEPATDGDGNILGGIRLPELMTILPGGERVGAPLGVYGGRDLGLSGDQGDGYARLGGTFTPFPPEETARRYPTREVYVDLVRRAAAALLNAGYILQEGYEFYVRAAQREPLPLEPAAEGGSTTGGR